jgi:hypothetical protein
VLRANASTSKGALVGSDGALTVTPQFAISGVGPAWCLVAANTTLPVTGPRRISGFLR